MCIISLLYCPPTFHNYHLSLLSFFYTLFVMCALYRQYHNISDLGGRSWFSMVGLVMGIWGTTVLVIDSNAQGECGNVWNYVLLSVINSFMAVIYNAFVIYNTKPYIIITVFSGTLSLTSIVWMFVIWMNQLNDECCDIYRNEYGYLWTFFQVTFWTITVIDLCVLGFLGFAILGRLCMNVCKKVYKKE